MRSPEAVKGHHLKDVTLDIRFLRGDHSVKIYLIPTIEPIVQAATRVRAAQMTCRGRQGGKMRSELIVVVTIAAALLFPHSLFGHHSSAAYDTGKRVILKGTVKEWVYSNPHCFLILEVKGEGGEVVVWTNETQAPSVIFAVGYRRDTFKFGQQVTVTVEPFKNSQPFGRILGVMFPDGKVLGPAVGPPPTAAAAPQP